MIHTMEGLETRRLLSASVVGGVLRAVGDAGVSNNIRVELNDAGTQYEVTINGTKTSFDVQGIRRIIVHGAELADQLQIDDSVNVRQNIFGYEGNDTITGGSAKDELAVKFNSRRGVRGWTRLWGMGGNDVIVAKGGRNFIDGGTGNDSITGSDGRDLIAGFSGNDTINAQGGNDIVHGGSGNDLIDLEDGNDLCLAGDGNDNVLGGSGNDRIFGQAGDDTLNGQDGDDSLFGILGNDSLFGENGNDLLVGGEGTDVLNGGNGTNRLIQRESSAISQLVDEAGRSSI